MLCAARETPVFMTLLLAHNDAHCIVLHVKQYPGWKPGLRSALAQRPETRGTPFSPSLPFPFFTLHPRPLPSLSLSSLPLRLRLFCLAAVFLSSLHNAPRAIKETNVNRGWLSFLNASTRLHNPLSPPSKMVKVGDVSGRKPVVPQRDGRFVTICLTCWSCKRARFTKDGKLRDEKGEDSCELT